MTDENKDVLPSPIDKTVSELVDNIIQEPDPKKTKDLVDIFNWNMSKRNVARIQKLNDLYDSITQQMAERVTKRADQFSNSDLLDYMKTIQGAIDTNTKNLTVVEEPPLIVQQHNTQINVNLADQFDREAKEIILAAVQNTLKLFKQSSVETTATIIDNSVNNTEMER